MVPAFVKVMMLIIALCVIDMNIFLAIPPLLC
jgi:hypothetical protein